MKRFSLIMALAILFSSGGDLPADETGDLKITFKLRGVAPKPKPLAIGGPLCGQFKNVDESLIVDPTTQGIQDVVVYIYTGRRGTKLPPQKPREKVVDLDNKNCRFEPHVVLTQAGDTLKVSNSDPVGHNVNLGFFNNPAINVVIPPNQFENVAIRQAEPTLIPAACNIHPWMTAHVLAVEHPFFAKSDKDGVLVIKDVPAGDEIIFRAWHERLTFKEEIFVDGKKTKWKANKFEVEIKPGTNDLGVVEVPL